LKGSHCPLNRRLFWPRDGTTSVGNGTTVVRAVCSLLAILAELPWLVAWMILFTIVREGLTLGVANERHMNEEGRKKVRREQYKRKFIEDFRRIFKQHFTNRPQIRNILLKC